MIVFGYFVSKYPVIWLLDIKTFMRIKEAGKIGNGPVMLLSSNAKSVILFVSKLPLIVPVRPFEAQLIFTTRFVTQIIPALLQQSILKVAKFAGCAISYFNCFAKVTMFGQSTETPRARAVRNI